MDLQHARFTSHALDQLRERQITMEMVHDVLANPDEVRPVRIGRVVAQAIVGKHLVRVFVDVDRDPPEVVTVYRTSQIAKYRNQP